MNDAMKESILTLKEFAAKCSDCYLPLVTSCGVFSITSSDKPMSKGDVDLVIDVYPFDNALEKCWFKNIKDAVQFRVLLPFNHGIIFNPDWWYAHPKAHILFAALTGAVATMIPNGPVLEILLVQEAHFNICSRNLLFKQNL